MSRGVLVAPSFAGGTEGVLLLMGDTRGDWTRVTSGGRTLGCSERVASVFEGTVASVATIHFVFHLSFLTALQGL